MTHRRLFIAPHLDDGAVSFGGTLLADRESASDTRTVVATVFSRSNYTKDGLGDAAVVTPIRHAEEETVMGSLGVDVIFLDFLEAPLRGYTISDPLDYPRRIRPELDADTVHRIAERLDELFEEFDEVLAPLAVGDQAHVDHRIVRRAAAVAWKKNPGPVFRLYEDAPYIGQANRDRASALDGLQPEESPIDLEAKLDLIQGYVSQPIAAWEELIRRTAGHPPVERTWIVRDPRVLEQVE